MKQGVNLWMILGAVVLLGGLIFGIYKLTSGGGETVGYTAPPASAGSAAEGQRKSEEYGKRMMENMKANGGKMPGGSDAPKGGRPGGYGGSMQR